MKASEPVSLSSLQFLLTYIPICVFKVESARNEEFVLFSNRIPWETSLKMIFVFIWGMYTESKFVRINKQQQKRAGPAAPIMSRVISDMANFRTQVSETPVHLILCSLTLESENLWKIAITTALSVWHWPCCQVMKWLPACGGSEPHPVSAGKSSQPVLCQEKTKIASLRKYNPLIIV